MKKLLLSTLVLLTIGSVYVSAGERPDQGDDYRVEIHKECIMHPVFTGTDKKQNPYTKQEYEITAYYDAVTRFRINTEVETIYIEADTDIYDINGNYYISIREEEVK